MSDLGTQMRELFDAQAPPLDLSELVAPSARERERRGRPLLLAAVVAAVLTALVTFVAQTVARQPPDAPVIAPVPPAPTGPTQEPTVEPGSRLSWEIVDPGLDGPWTLVDGGDRFLAVSRLGELRTSSDGSAWTELPGSLEPGDRFAAWGASVLSWSEPGAGTRAVTLRLADGVVEQLSVPGVVGAAVGPAGAVIAASLSAEQARRAFGAEDIEEPGDAWHTIDGRTWEPASGFPPELHELTMVGTTSGFYVAPLLGPPGELWHSADGRSWRPVPGAGDAPQSIAGRHLTRWRDDGLLLSVTREGLEYHHVAPTGLELLFRADDVDRTVHFLRTAAGPLGIVTIDLEDRHLVYSTTGNDVRTEPLSDDVPADPLHTELAMTDQAILLVTDDPAGRGDGDGTADRIWFLGRPIPPGETRSAP
jgi:hypothetical protein